MDNASGARKKRPQRQGQKMPLYAAVDLGTNNCRLLVARPHGTSFRVVDSYSQVVRLGEGLAATGQLSEASMGRAVSALKAIRQKLRHHKVGKVRCIATEACRKAGNGADFIQKAREETGLSFKIIGASEEARLAAIGCHDLIDNEADLVMVLDIGGGSTEISFVDLKGLEDRSLKGLLNAVPIKAWRSFPLGVVTLTESHTNDDDPYTAMREHARSLMTDWTQGAAFSEMVRDNQSYIIGTSGTVTCLAGIHLKLQKYRRDKVDGIWMEYGEAREIIQRLNSLGREGRIALPTIGEERADLMMAGCAILDAAWDIWPADRLRVADRGLREGLLLSMMYGTRKRSRGGKRRSRGRKNPRREGGAAAPSQSEGSGQ